LSPTTALQNTLDKKKLKYDVCPEEGAFYGPKIDVGIKDALGRMWQCATIQCDFALPEAFRLEYVSRSGKKERPVVLHRAILGSVERFMGCLIEHYAGAFPLWLSPVQAVLLPVAKNHEGYCSEVKRTLQDAGIRVSFFDSTDTLGRRIRQAQGEKIPYMLVVGDKEVKERQVTVRRRSGKDQELLSIADFSKKCLAEIADKKV